MKGIGLKTLIKGFVESVKNAKKSWKMMKASGMWMRAKKEADEKRKADGHRYFVIYDAGQKKLISITYDIYESRGDSYQYLRQRGRFKRPLTRDELKALCFYYHYRGAGFNRCQRRRRAYSKRQRHRKGSRQ